MIVIDTEISLGSVDDHDHSFLDILKGLERLQQILSQFW